MGAAFSGQAGGLLDSLLRTNGLRRDKAHLTNAALCRGESDKENDKAAECCAPRLLRELHGIRRPANSSSRRNGGDSNVETLDCVAPPTLLLGKAAARAVLGVTSIITSRGFVYSGREISEATIKAAGKAKGERAPLRAATLMGRAALEGRPFLVALHPSWVLRADTWKPILEIDFNRFGRFVKAGGLPLADDASYSLRIQDLATLGKVVSLDIETDGVKVLETKILSVQISDGERTVIIWPWKAEYAKPLSKWLRTRSTVVTHNGTTFDIPVLRQHNVF
jgi:uracil-DNA glycosylase